VAFSTCDGSKPRSIDSALRTLRTNSAAAMSSTSETATCATTSALRARCRPPPSAVPRPPSRSTEFRSARDARNAGNSPTPMPDASATAAM
jgi:hypothetical protein